MKRVLILLAPLILVCAAFGQVRTSSRMNQSPFLNAGTGYLMMPAVQKELGLSATVSKKIQDKMMSVSRNTMGPTTRSTTPNDQEAQMAAFRKRMEGIQKVQSECLALLSPPQKARLRQITIQQMGAQAMYNPEIRKELGLTESQAKKISAIMQQNFRSVFAGSPGKQGEKRTREDAMKQMQEFAKKQAAAKDKVDSQALKVLTPAQQSKWKALKGKPFKLDMMRMMPRVSAG